MTWTAPRTWVASEVVTAAIMNQHVRDNFLAAQDRIQTVFKDADQTVNNSTVLVSDSKLKFSAVAGQNYIFDMNIILVCLSATPEFTQGFSFPAGTLAFSTSGLDPAATSSTAQARMPGTASATSGVATLTVATPSVTTGVLVRGTFKCTTSGTVTFMWAQNVATAVATTVSQGSSLVAIRESI